MNYALIKNGKVKNVIVADADFIHHIAHDYDEVILLEDNPAGPGWSYADGVFTRPGKSPEQVTKEERRARLGERKKDKSQLPVAGQALKDLLADILEEL